MSKQKGRGESRGIVDRARDALGIQTQEPPIQAQDISVEDRGRELDRLLDEIHKEEKTMETSAARVKDLRRKADAAETALADASRAERLKNRVYWPEGLAMPEFYPKRQPMPCPKCRRVLLDNFCQAVTCVSSGIETVSLKCHSCGNTWQMPVGKPGKKIVTDQYDITLPFNFRRIDCQSR